MKDSFRQGLFESSIWPVIVGAFFFFGPVLLLSWFMQGPFFDSISPMQMLHEKADGATMAAYRINKFNRTEKKPTIFLLGSSGLKEATQSQRELNRMGLGLPIKKLVTSGQTLAESLRFIEAIKGEGHTIVLGVNYIRFYHDKGAFQREEKKLSLVPYSNQLATFLQIDRNSTVRSLSVSGLFFHLRLFFSERKSRGLGLGPIRFSDHLYDDLPKLSEGQHIENESKLVQNFHGKFYENFEFNLLALNKIIDLVRLKKSKLILLELPMNPRVWAVNGKVLQVYFPKIRSISSVQNIPYWNFVRTLKLSKEHYYDFTHLNPQGREIYQRHLNKLLGDIP